jgi:hypothetical protein
MERSEAKQLRYPTEASLREDKVTGEEEDRVMDPLPGSQVKGQVERWFRKKTPESSAGGGHLLFFLHDAVEYRRPRQVRWALAAARLQAAPRLRQAPQETILILQRARRPQG